MAINTEITKQICDFVRIKPRNIQEIAFLIKKNWRTAERYVERIEKETGCIATRIFREGTRGALKIVYWNSVEEIHNTSFQEVLFNKIMNRAHKADFSPFDIYQHVADSEKKAYIEDASRIGHDLNVSKEQDLVGLLRSASKQVFVFSGNLSWINARQGKVRVIEVIKELAKRKVSVKIICRVSIVGVDNVKKLLAINEEVGREVIEIRHRYQPLRAMIIDSRIVKLREIKDPAYYMQDELKKKIKIFYDIYDRDWIEWLQKIFWKMFSIGMPAEKRIGEIEKIQNMIVLLK